ncbi:DoxX family protein [Jatrophihabitans sp. DSM 45814]
MASISGSEIARLLLRLSIGGTLIAHGVKHGRSLEGTGRWFESIGFKQPDLQAKMSAGVEVAAGSALIVGAATPLAAAAIVGTMAVAAHTVHRPNGFFITSEGVEYVAALSAASVAVGALGGGKYSLDGLLGLEKKLSGGRGAAIAAGLGLAGAAVQLKTFWERPAPKAS